VLVTWLRQHAGSIGQTVAADVDDANALAALVASPIVPTGTTLVPLERLALPSALFGAAGENRSPAFPYVRARHDLDAVFAYLHNYTDSPATLRAYSRELERLLLWCVLERCLALSSMAVEDCEAYKAFLAAPGEAFTGPAASRESGRWRPFSPHGLSPASQKYAVRALRAAFDWLVDVRYLAGSPWRAVRDPKR
jgi:integrase/recombinase XerD